MKLKNLFLSVLVYFSSRVNGFEENFENRSIDKTDLFSKSIASIDEKCRRDMDSYEEALLRKENWALTMLDSSVKMPSGLLHGNLKHFGDFDECIEIREPYEAGYCLAKIKLKTDNMSDVEVTLAQCMPSSCTGSDLENYLSNGFLRSLVLPGVQYEVLTNATQCQSKSSQRTFSTVDWVVIAVLVTYFKFIISTTLIEIFLSKTAKPINRYLQSFSLKSNIVRTFRVSRSPEIIHSINGIRVIATIWIVLGHTHAKYRFLPLTDFHDFVKFPETIGNALIYGGFLSVDTFFFISGVIGCYTFLKAMNKGISFNVPLFYLQRYIRLTPILIVVLIIYVTIQPKLGNGPLWPELVIRMTENCEKYWWSLMLYVQNFTNFEEICIPQTWYLSVDMQLFLISPLILYPLYKRPKLGLAIIAVLTIFSCGILYYIVAKYEIDILFTSGGYETVHIKPYTRASPWLLGLAVGYYIHFTKDKPVHMGKPLLIVGWISSIVGFLSCIFGAYPLYQRPITYHQFWVPFYHIASKVVWSLSHAWVIVTCFHGYGGKVNSFLGSGTMQVLARFSYSLFIFHYSVVYIQAGIQRTNVVLDPYHSLYLFCGDLCYSIVVTIIFYFMFELPLALFFDNLLFKKGKRQKPVVNESNGALKIDVFKQTKDEFNLKIEKENQQ